MSKKLIILSGLSGSGNSTLLKELIDLNYFVFTSLKSDKYPEILERILSDSENEKIAVFLNITPNFNELYDNIIGVVSKFDDIEFKQIFLKCKKEIIINRYQENRKIHPYIKNYDHKANIDNAIDFELYESSKFIKKSDYIIDTTSLVPAQLIKVFKSYINEDSNFTINLISFGFKYGAYQYTDYMFDVRFLKNPYYIDELRPRSGENKIVQDYVFSDEDAKAFLQNILSLIDIVVPRFSQVSKNSITISIGCTGGMHRSVAYVELLGKILNDKYNVNKIHLEKEKGYWND